MFLFFFYVMIAAVWLAAWVQIFSKAGYSGWLSLLTLVPVVNVIVLLWFAFSTWPVLERRRVPRTE